MRMLKLLLHVFCLLFFVFLLVFQGGISGCYFLILNIFLFLILLWLYYDYVRQNGPLHAFSHVDVGSPPSAHDFHAGYGRSISKPSYFTPHVSQNSPSRLGQRFSHGRLAVRGSEWNPIKVQPPSSSFSSGGQRSPGSSSLSNSMPWGTS
jgi:hypothetical protein